MATFSNAAAQIVGTQQNVVYNTPVYYPQNCQNSIIYTDGSGLVGLRGSNCTCNPAKYRVSFGANIAIPTGGTVGPIALALSQNGEAIPATISVATPTVDGVFFNVGRPWEIVVPCGCCYQIGVKNVVPTGGTAQDISVSNASLTVTRIG